MVIYIYNCSRVYVYYFMIMCVFESSNILHEVTDQWLTVGKNIQYRSKNCYNNNILCI